MHVWKGHNMHANSNHADSRSVETMVQMAAADEIEIVHSLTLRAFEEYRGMLEPPTGVLTESIQNAVDAVRTRRAAIARLNGNPAGAVRWEAHGDRFYVGRLAVIPEFRRRGVAGALMDFAESRAGETGFAVVQVMVRAALSDNVAFFSHRGYGVTSTDPHPRNPAHLVHTMEKHIGFPVHAPEQ